MNPKLSNKDVAEEFDEYRDTYSENVNAALLLPGMDVDYFTRVKAGHLIDLAGQHFGSTERLTLLDVGCGVGNYHRLLDGAFRQISGVDISPASVEKARSTNPAVDYHVYDGETLPFPDDQFDVAVAICVVHHVPVGARPDFFREFRRVLKPGGLGLIFEHNPANPLTRRVVDRCPFDANAVLLNQNTALSLLGMAGFQRTWSRSIVSIPSFGRVSRKLDRALGVVPLGAQYFASGVK